MSPASAAALRRAVAERESQIVVGVDPDPAKLWPASTERLSEARARLAGALAATDDAARALVRAAAGSPPPPLAAVPNFETAAAVLAHALALIDAAAPACVAAKPQLAFFEQLGFAGWLALERVCDHAATAGCSCSPTASAATSRAPPPPTRPR